MSVFNRIDDGLRRDTKALAVLPDMRSTNPRSIESRLDEFVGLASAIGINTVDRLALRIRKVRLATLFGVGQIEQLRALVLAAKAELVLVDGLLTPVQQAKLEEALSAKVIDRTGLILEIFGERAASAEGRLQVELAHLDYQAGRLVRSWTHLERQRGGFGFLGGPGETQIEADRRMIRDRMARLRRDLSDLTRTRSLHRERRGRAPWPVIALVGYTNAGKSTLFNHLTGASVMAEDMLFATLDPTMRDIGLPGIAKAILSDTVGFVSDLPTQLIAAFQATLEEVTSADLIVHVRDISHPDSEAQRSDVLKVLEGIGAGSAADQKVIEVWNKLDLVDPEMRVVLAEDSKIRDNISLISAISGEGIASLKDSIVAILTQDYSIKDYEISNTDGAARAWLHARGRVISERVTHQTTLISVQLSSEDAARFQSRDFA